MENPPADPLFVALRDGGRVPAEKVDVVSRAFVECGRNPEGLAERLNAAGVVTRYQYKKVQTGRTADLLLGPYLILDKIGEGGMGKVYRAVQWRTGRLVALKVVRPQLMANRTVVKRYEREAAAAARLDHPNIVRLFDAELADGRYFLAMEYIEGLDLSRLVKQFGPLPYQEACEYIRQAALGLHHAHQHALIHRDIKPSNLLVQGERALPGTNGKANVKVLDLGLVRSLLEEEAGQTELTRDGTVVGTPDYMSPEQAKNSSQVTPQADIYSLGCTLYYLLTARPPYPDGTPVEKLIKHQLDPFPDPRRLAPSVPPAVVRVLNDMTAKRLTDRIATAEAVATALAPYTGAGIADTFDLFTPPSAGAPSGRLPNVAPVPAPTAAPPSSLVAVATQTPTATRAGGTTVPAGRGGRPKAIPLSAPEPEPHSAETAAADPKATKPNPAGSSGSTGVPAPATRKIRRPAPKAAAVKARGPFPLTLVAGCVLAALLLVALALLVFQKPRTPTTSPTDPPKGGTPPAPPPAAPFRPIEDLLPEKATAVLLSHPKAFFDRFALEPKPSSPLNRAFDRTTRRFLLDPRKVDRVVVAFTGAPKGFVVTAEGGVLKADWVQELGKLPERTVQLPKDVKDPNGAKRLKFPLPVQPKSPARPWVFSDTEGAVLAGPPVALLLADPADPLARIVRRNGDKPAEWGPPAELSVELLTETRMAAARAPLLHFAASGSYRLPSKTWGSGDTLTSLGVTHLTAEVRLEKGFVVELTVTGDKFDQVRNFLDVELPGRLRKWSQPLKPLGDACVKEEPKLLSATTGVRMSRTVRLDWDVTLAALDSLLFAYPLDK